MKKLAILIALCASPALAQQADPFASTQGATSMTAEGAAIGGAIAASIAVIAIAGAVSSSSSTTN